MKRLSVILLASMTCLAAQAFIPPVGAIVREIFDGRKPRPRGTEVVLRHHVEVRAGETVELEERIVAERGGRPRFIWKVMGQGLSVPGTWERAGYMINGDKQQQSKSGAFLKYMLTTNGDEFLNQLVAEGFVRRDQLFQFKQGWQPEGDPTTWDLRANYLRHPDIYLHRVRRGIGIAVVGTQDGANQKVVYFDHALKGVRRMEWTDGQTNVAWELDMFSSSTKEGLFPRQMVMEVNGEDKVRTELLAVRQLTDRGAAEFNNAHSRTAGSLPGSVENALHLLLSHR